MKDFEQTSRFCNKYLIRNVVLGAIDNDKLHGTLYRQSTNVFKERLYPTYFVLSQQTESDFDGNNDNFTMENVYPNPFSENINVYISVKQNDNISFEIDDVSGRVIYSLPPRDLDDGNHCITLSPRGLNVGHYLIRATGLFNTSALTITKQ